MRGFLVVASLGDGVSGASAQSPPSVKGKWLTASKVAADVQIAPRADPARGPACGTPMSGDTQIWKRVQ